MSSQTAPAVIPNFDDDSHSGRNTAMHLPVGDARLPAALAPVSGIQAMINVRQFIEMTNGAKLLFI